MGRIRVFALLACVSFLAAQSTAVLESKVSVPPQCSQYSIVDDQTRHVNAPGADQCDTMFISGTSWIRFEGLSGTELATSPTTADRCGAQVAGWYAGQKPSVYETINDGVVCFSWGNNSCHWRNTIDVTNCGSFYIYKLTLPPVCPARYCTETPYVPTTTPTTTTSTPDPSPIAPQCHSYTTINDPSRGVDHGGDNNCDQSVFSSGPMWVRFEGDGGTQIPTSGLQSHKCSTHAPGWYSGSMPTSLYETTSGNVCFSFNSDNCAWSQNISVTNCGSFYIYRLSSPPACSLRYCTETPNVPVAPPECNSHTVIDDPSRNVYSPQTNSLCDQNTFSNPGTWVRFVGTGGTQIPTSVTQPNQCNTHASGWYTGSMPDAPYTTTSGKVCFSWSGNTCYGESNIKVTHCGSFYVYHLPPTGSCQLRYCTSHPGAPVKAKKSAGTFTSISGFFQNLFRKAKNWGR